MFRFENSFPLQAKKTVSEPALLPRHKAKHFGTLHAQIPIIVLNPKWEDISEPILQIAYPVFIVPEGRGHPLDALILTIL